MKNLMLILLFVLAATGVRAQSMYFPPVTGNTWDTTSPSSLGWCTDKIDSLLNYLGSKNTKAFILLKNGKIVIEKYFGTFTQDSTWYWASAGKSLTSFAVGIAQQEGYLSITDTTSRIIGFGWTSCPLLKERKITVLNHLTMTTGLDDSVPDQSCTAPSCLQYKADAGTRWAYHTAAYTMLDSIMLAATGQNINTYVTQKIKTPTGMTGTFVMTGEDNVFYSKPRSMARYGLLVLNKGNWNGTQLMTDTAYFNHMVNTSQTLNKSYGYLWWLNGKASFMAPQTQHIFLGPLNPSAPSDMIAALGKNGQMINIVPSQQLVYIRMGDAPGVGEVPIYFNDTIWQKLNQAMCTSLRAATVGEQGGGAGAEPVLYPNPAGGDFAISFPGTRFDYIVYDVTGKAILQGKNCFDRLSITKATLCNGIYYVKIIDGTNRAFTLKLVVTQ
ncbi:serine hydrolase [Chitinophagaceae bacterium MMS25-I14]